MEYFKEMFNNSKMNCCDETLEALCPVCGSIDESKYMQIDNKISMNKISEMNILSELKEFKLTDEIKIQTTILYQEAVGGKTRRNAPRRATIYCCLIATCKKYNIIFDKDEFQALLNIKSRDINKASKSIKANIDDLDIEIGITDIIKCILVSYDIKMECLYEILDMYELCLKKSKLFNSSKMETLAYGLVYYYLKIKLVEFDEEDYFSKSRVSKETVITIYMEISKYFEIEK